MKKLLLLFIASFIMNSCFKQENVTEAKHSDSIVKEIDSTNLFNDNNIYSDSIKYLNDSAQIPITKMDYSTAKTENTSEGWRKFLNDNPDYKNKKEIEENIIRAEVDEIVNNKDTGAMPESEKTSKGNYKTSAIEVENDTSCELTLRYSGTDAKLVRVPANSKLKVSVSSGNYTVAATACGYNYAGRETLNGDYSVVYYITTTRY